MIGEQTRENFEKDGIEVKTIDGWNEFAKKTKEKSWDNYCRPGDVADKGVYDYFSDILPPHSMKKGYLQVGEPHSTVRNPKTGKYQETYATFIGIGNGLWMYCGNCFTGERADAESYIDYGDIRGFLKATYRERLGITTIRPRVLCADGFEVSVQAGRALYSMPRENRPEGDYESCELGFPNMVEELLLEYAENRRKPKNTVYPYVPVEVIDEVIKKHGGFYNGLPPFVGKESGNGQ